MHDLVIDNARPLFDPATVATRLDTPAVGLHGAWVNGVGIADERGVRRDCRRLGRVPRQFTTG